MPLAARVWAGRGPSQERKVRVKGASSAVAPTDTT